MIVIIPDGDIIVTSLTLNGCVSLWHRATPVAKPRPGILFYCVAPKQSCQHPKECFPLFHRQLRATFTRPSNQFRAPLSPHPSIGGKKERKKKSGMGEKPLTVPPRYFLSNLDIPRFFSFYFFHCSPISSIFHLFVYFVQRILTNNWRLLKVEDNIFEFINPI